MSVTLETWVWKEVLWSFFVAVSKIQGTMEKKSKQKEYTGWRIDKSSVRPSFCIDVTTTPRTESFSLHWDVNWTLAVWFLDAHTGSNRDPGPLWSLTVPLDYCPVGCDSCEEFWKTRNPPVLGINFSFLYFAWTQKKKNGKKFLSPWHFTLTS